MKHFYLSFSFLLISFLTFSQCVENLNFHAWEVEGNPDATWNILSDSVVVENGDAHPPTFFVTNTNLLNVKVRGTMRAELTNDDDFIGFVFGYEKPNDHSAHDDYKFILFDWKRRNGVTHGYQAREGYTLTKVNRKITGNDFWKYFWGHTDQPGEFDVLSRSYGSGKGWEYNTDYHFELTYTSSRIVISINGDTIFQTPGCFEPGRFGFYTFSQQKIQFSNFDYQLDFDFKVSNEERCVNDPIEFIVIDEECSIIPTNIKEWLWDFGDGTILESINPTHTFNQADLYDVTLIVTDFNNCSDTTSRKVTIHDYPMIDLPADTLVNYGDSLILDAGNIAIWSDGSVSQSITIENILQPFDIWLDVSLNGCNTRHDMFIDVIPPPIARVYAPNAFTPNGDGLNDLFLPAMKNVMNFRMLIYDRWGKLIFESKSQYDGWNGKANGSAYPTGTYVYIIDYDGYDENITITPGQTSGTVTLIR